MRRTDLGSMPWLTAHSMYFLVLGEMGLPGASLEYYKINYQYQRYFPLSRYNTLMLNAAKLREIGFLIQKSGKKAGCFISDPLPPVNASLVFGGCNDALAACMAWEAAG